MTHKIIFTCLLTCYLHFTVCSQKINIDKAFSQAESQTKIMLGEVEKVRTGKLVFPRTIEPSGELRMVASRDWTSGFFPGVLWYLYEYSDNESWKPIAEAFTKKIEKEKFNGGTHDMGFKIYCSFGNGYRLTNNPAYREVIIQSAETLITRYNPRVGALRSWDHHADQWKFPVIIDNMMNLELLFATTRLTGDSTFYNIAVSHANTTMENHFRADYGTYHVVSYDPETGEVEKKNTHQGYSDESTWARGQAWALYGYTMCYRETKDPAYLEQADKIARFILDHPNLPKDLIPYWDFNAPEIPHEERDVSAAALMASAFYELSTYSDNGKTYLKAADTILKNLIEKYAAPAREARGFILLHSVGSKPSGSEVDVPLNYADYYYLEGLLRKDYLNQGKELF